MTVGACEYNVTSTPHVFSSSLLTLHYWVLDSMCAFPFTFDPLTITSNFFQLTFVCSELFVLTTEHIERSPRH